MLKLLLSSTVMTVTTTKLMRLYKLFAQVSLHVGPVKLNKMEPFHLGYVFLVLIWVGLFVLLCDKKVMWICHQIKQIFHSSLKNRSAFRLVPYITSYSSHCRGISVKYLVFAENISVVS